MILKLALVLLVPSTPEIFQAVELARIKLQEYRVELKVTDILQIEEPCTGYASLDTLESGNSASRLYCLIRTLHSLLKHPKKGTVYFFVSPPIASEYLAGRAWGYCQSRKYPMYAMGNYESGRVNELALTMVHEPMHAKGMYHDESNQNLMSVGALAYAADFLELGFNAQGLKELKRCRRQNGAR